MRTISVRQFRDNIATITEPVDVARRGPSGFYTILGRWQPRLPDALVDPETGTVVGHALTVTPNRIVMKDGQAQRDAILHKINRGG